MVCINPIAREIAQSIESPSAGPSKAIKRLLTLDTPGPSAAKVYRLLRYLK